MLGLFVAVVTGTFERARERYRTTRKVRGVMDDSSSLNDNSFMDDGEVLRGDVQVASEHS